ncbi:MAG: galactokinase [Beutenbergiaceae bacterium]
MPDSLIHAWSDSDGHRAATEAFGAAFESEPDGVWYAPGRVNLIGEHTDYNGGLALPIALPHRTFAAVRLRSDDQVRLVSQAEATAWHGQLSEVAPGTVSGWAGYAVGVAWSLGQRGWPTTGFDAAIASCVPYGAGLSSSAALEGAIGLGLSHGSAISRPELADVCVQAENRIAGANTGGMDQAASLQCQQGHALLLDCATGNTQQLPFDLQSAGLQLLVIDTRAPHALVDGQYAQRRATCEQAASQLGVATLGQIDPQDLHSVLARLPDDVVRARVRHVVTEIGRVREFAALLSSGQLAQVGSIMDASHASLRDDYDVSCRELDLAQDSARRAGALGARMTGGGFGGSAVALVPSEQTAAVCAAVSAAFADAGLRPPAFLAVTPSAAGGRVG